MELQNILSFIESIEFATGYTPISNLNSLFNTLQTDTHILELISQLQTPEAKAFFYHRLLQLLPANPHPEYAHPLDEAITAYLYALSQVDHDLTQQAAAAVLATPRLWWAKRMAQHLQAAQPETAP
jgi:hypothetical protein